jgi:hypothetical protein
MHTEGVFRIRKNEQEIKSIKNAFEGGFARLAASLTLKDLTGGEQVDLSGYDACNLGAVLLDFFQQSPEPVVPRQLYDELVTVAGIHDVEKQATMLNNVIERIPDELSTVLFYLLRFLYYYSIHSHAASAALNELASAFGPVVIWKHKEGARQTVVKNVFLLLLENYGPMQVPSPPPPLTAAQDDEEDNNSTPQASESPAGNDIITNIKAMSANSSRLLRELAQSQERLATDVTPPLHQ